MQIGSVASGVRGRYGRRVVYSERQFCFRAKHSRSTRGTDG